MKYAAPKIGVVKYALPLIAILLLAGCSKPKDLAFYKSNPAERGKSIEACASSGEDSDECRNAKEAEVEAYQDNAVAYYKAHPADLAKHMEACSSSGEASDDCKNAKRAQAEMGGPPATPAKPTTTAQK